MAAIALWYGLGRAQAQDENAVSNQSKSEKSVIREGKPQPDQHGEPLKPYRLDFSFYELADGKKINGRHYSMNLIAGSGPDEIKIGTRVPVRTGADNSIFQYMDVGTRIWSNLREGRSDDVQIEVKSEISNLDIAQGHEGSTSLPPVVRQIQINGYTLLVTGKPILIGSMDDPNSNRQFQLEVMATKLHE
jgi:hypothetical protein